MNGKIRFFDSTLRDGSHAVKQKLTADNIGRYCCAADSVGMYTVIVGHGNGLGASSIQMGEALLDGQDMLKIAHEHLRRTRLGAFITVGFGTVRGHIIPALQNHTEVFCVAAHCTEADTMQKHIPFIKENGKEAYGILMNVHMAEPAGILSEAKKIESYGADGVILMDSAGTLTPERTKAIITGLSDGLKMQIGFHAHNNLGLAVANTYEAIQAGASIVDGTTRGFGSGAGNCQLEVIAALLKKEERPTDVDLYALLDLSEEIVERDFHYHNPVNSVSIISGYAGVVSTLKTKAERVAREYQLDPRDIFIELGKRNAIAGQDDLILEVAQRLSEIKKSCASQGQTR